MNNSMVRFVLGQILRLEGILMLLPWMIGLIYREPQCWPYLGVGLLCILLGTLSTIKRPKSQVFYLKEGCMATALSWIIMSLFGCLPFWISGEIPSFTDALFETVSGFTTTGASIVAEVETLAYCTNFWRCFTHWIGGMGVLVFMLAVIPLSGGSNVNLMRAESPGPSVGKLVPKIRYTAQYLYLIYCILTGTMIVLLLVAKMTPYQAVCTAFGTAGTGGFGVKNDSLTSFSPTIQWITTIFMILFGVNFNAYFLLLFRKFKKAVLMEELRYYVLIIGAAVAFITISLCHSAYSILDALRLAAFQVGSIMTTTGFSTADFDTWSSACRMVLVLLMFIGACAGSTGGGIKVSRIVLLTKTVRKEMGTFVHPKSVAKVNMDGKPVEHAVVRATNVFFMTFVMIFVVSLFVVSLEGHDLVTNFTAVAATMNNIGPGLSMVGATQNYAFFSGLSKYVLMFDMLAGRLELFPMLVLFHPGIWRDVVKQRMKRRKGKQA